MFRNITTLFLCLFVYRGELLRWVEYCAKLDSKPTSFADLFAVFNQTMQCLYPNIYRLTIISVTLPPTTACVERTFSTLKRIMSDRRSTSTHERVSDLTIISAYRNWVLTWAEDDQLMNELVTNYANVAPKRIRLKWKIIHYPFVFFNLMHDVASYNHLLCIELWFKKNFFNVYMIFLH